jgi:hypothetical protein
MLRDLMLRLVTQDDVGDPVRTRVPRRSVTGDGEHLQLVERLLGARLLASDGETVEIAHESLAVAWPRLRSWLDEDVDGLRIRRHLAVAAESWDELGRPDSELYRGVRQARAAEWQARAGASLTETERDFLHNSAALVEKEQRATEAQVRRERRLNQRLRLGLGAVAALLAVAIVAGALAITAAERRPAGRRRARPGALRRRPPARCRGAAVRRPRPFAAPRGRGRDAGRLGGHPHQPARDARPLSRPGGQRPECRPDLPHGPQHRDRPGGGDGR